MDCSPRTCRPPRRAALDRSAGAVGLGPHLVPQPRVVRQRGGPLGRPHRVVEVEQQRPAPDPGQCRSRRTTVNACGASPSAGNVNSSPRRRPSGLGPATTAGRASGVSTYSMTTSPGSVELLAPCSDRAGLDLDGRPRCPLRVPPPAAGASKSAATGPAPVPMPSTVNRPPTGSASCRCAGDGQTEQPATGGALRESAPVVLCCRAPACPGSPSRTDSPAPARRARPAAACPTPPTASTSTCNQRIQIERRCRLGRTQRRGQVGDLGLVVAPPDQRRRPAGRCRHRAARPSRRRTLASPAPPASRAGRRRSAAADGGQQRRRGGRARPAATRSAPTVSAATSRRACAATSQAVAANDSRATATVTTSITRLPRPRRDS